MYRLLYAFHLLLLPPIVVEAVVVLYFLIPALEGYKITHTTDLQLRPCGMNRAWLQAHARLLNKHRSLANGAQKQTRAKSAYND
jgi:hypothetical protein